MNNVSNGEMRIERVKFPKGKIQLILSNGTIVVCPIKNFPEIKKLPLKERKKYGTLAGVGLAFENSDAVYHISEFLGGHNYQIGE